MSDPTATAAAGSDPARDDTEFWFDEPGTPTAEADDDIGAIGDKALFGPGGRGAAKFDLKRSAPICDLVMKGGVTSGVVYPYAILRMAQKFRIAGIGGTSAGAIAAALTAAAEYGRQTGVDQRPPAKGAPPNPPDRTRSFSRFEQWCLQIPTHLQSFFQPVPAHRPGFALATALMEALDPSPDFRTRRRAAARLFLGPAGWITWSIFAGAVAGGALGAVRYIWFYGRHIGVGPHTGAIQPGWATGLLAGGLGWASGVLLLVLMALAIGLKRHLPLWIWLGAAAVAAAASIEGSLGSLIAVASPAIPGGALGAVAVAGLAFDQLVARLRDSDFGMCSGLTQDRAGGQPGLTDWLHAAIQDVAGLPLGQPLTFGDVEGAVADKGPKLKLRMIVTNLTQRRPFALPDFSDPSAAALDETSAAPAGFGWRPDEWEKLFPKEILTYLKGLEPNPRGPTDIWPLPSGDRLPVLVGARMSLSFPLLFSAVPVYDLQELAAVRPSEEGLSRRRYEKALAAWRRRGRMLMIDGGLSSNMPLHFFDNLGPPAYPTFAFNLDDDPSLTRRTGDGSRFRRLLTQDELRLDASRTKDDLAAERISLHDPTRPNPRLRRMADGLFLQYVGGLLGAAKDWQDSLLSIMPGQFDRIVTIKLAPGEGGLNLTMPKARSELLMQLGYLAGREVVTKFDLDAHRVRRALASIQEIERVALNFRINWRAAKLDQKLKDAEPKLDPVTGAHWTADRARVIARFTELVDWAEIFERQPTHGHQVRPRGSLRITPNLSGDL